MIKELKLWMLIPFASLFRTVKLVFWVFDSEDESVRTARGLLMMYLGIYNLFWGIVLLAIIDINF